MISDDPGSASDKNMRKNSGHGRPVAITDLEVCQDRLLLYLKVLGISPEKRLKLALEILSKSVTQLSDDNPTAAVMRETRARLNACLPATGNAGRGPENFNRHFFCSIMDRLQPAPPLHLGEMVVEHYNNPAARRSFFFLPNTLKKVTQRILTKILPYPSKFKTHPCKKNGSISLREKKGYHA